MLLLLLLVVMIILSVPLYLIYKPPPILIRYFQTRWPDVLWHVETNKRIVALTIDDAPSEYSQEILQILSSNNATATFFTIGSQVPGREVVLTDMVKASHELGNHAMYDEPSKSLSDTELQRQIEDVRSLITKAYESANFPVPQRQFFRPGSGFFSRRMLDLVARLDYKLVLGSVYPHDPQISNANVNARHILSMVRPGAIVICHDRRPWTAPMLRIVLPELQSRGFEVTTLSSLLEQAKG